MSIVHEPVEDAVGDRRIADLRVPGGDRQLAGQQGGMHLITPIADLQKIPALCLGQRRSEEHTSELQSPCKLVCRLLLVKKKNSAIAARRAETASTDSPAGPCANNE